MPRMNLTDEEAKLILRQREVEDAHSAGWNKALTYLDNWIDAGDSTGLGEDGPTFNEIRARIKEMMK